MLFAFSETGHLQKRERRKNSTHSKKMRVNHCITTVELTSNVFCPFSFRCVVQHVFHLKCLCTCDGNTTPRRWRKAAPQKRKKSKYHHPKERGEAAPHPKECGEAATSYIIDFTFVSNQKKGGTAAPHEGGGEVKSSTTHKGEDEGGTTQEGQPAPHQRRSRQ